MKIVNNKITKATEAELYYYYLVHYIKCGYDDIYTFQKFIERTKDKGVKIIEEDNT